MSNAALILAAGRGERIQKISSDKPLTPLAGRPAIAYSIEAFLKSRCVQTIAVIYRNNSQKEQLQAALAETAPCGHSESKPESFLWIQGGAERQDSVLNGLHALPEKTRYVFIHDAARPLISPEVIHLLSKRVAETGAACLARRVTDTIKQARPATDLALDANILHTIDRSRLWAVETPQVFDRSLILTAYERVIAAGLRITDDTAALEESNHPIALIENDSPNPKLTTPAEVPWIEYLLTANRKL